MKKFKVKHGSYRKMKKSEPKQFLVNNPWPYRGNRWRKIEQNYEIFSRMIINHIENETKNILIGGNEIYTEPDGIDHNIKEKN